MGNDSLTYLEELRTRLLRILVVFTGVLMVALCFSRLLLQHVIGFSDITHGFAVNLVVFSWFEGAYVVFSLACYVAWLLTLPMILYEMASFVLPALMQEERSVLWLLFGGAVVLFYLGVGVGLIWVLPVLMVYAGWFLPPGISWVLSLSSYLHMMWLSMLLSGLAMQLPLVFGSLTWLGWVDYARLAHMRSSVLLLILVVAMVLTPPDMFAQVLLAVPMYGLFEVSVLLSWCVGQLRSPSMCVEVNVD